jgi:hypothetical protein
LASLVSDAAGDESLFFWKTHFGCVSIFIRDRTMAKGGNHRGADPEFPSLLKNNRKSSCEFFSL